MKKAKMKKSLGKKKGPMDLEEMEEASTNVSNLSKVDIVNMTDLGNPDLMSMALPKESPPNGKSKKPAAVKHVDRKLTDKSANNRAGGESTVNERINFGRTELLEDSLQLQYYPLQHVKSIVSKLKSRATEAQEFVLDFTGIEQLTDFVFYLFLTNPEESLKKVTAVDLTGCLHITDQGLIWLASAFTGLKKLKVNGCSHVTETGLYHVIKLSKSLKELNIRGTSVSILPKSITKYLVNMDGYPLISPDREMFNKGGFKLLQAPGYPKPTDEDIVKLCIIQGPGSTKSLIKHLALEYENTLEPLVVKYNFKVRSNYTANMIECDESICDLFITKRTLYALPVQAVSSESKAEAKRLFSLMCYIIVKVHSAAFIVVGLNDGDGKTCTSAEIKAELANLIQIEKTSLNKELQTLKQADKLKNLDFPQQESWKGRCILSKALENLFVEYCDVNVKQRYEEAAPIQTCLIKGMKAICDMYPEFQEIAQPVFSFAMSESTEKTLKDGVLSLETAKSSSYRMMQFMAVMGKTACIPILQDVPVVCLNAWLAKVISVACNPPPDAKNEGRVLGVKDDASMWHLDSLKTALEHTVGKEQAVTGVAILIKLGLSVHQSVFLPYKELELQPVIPVEHFFPEVSNGRDGVLACVYYRVDFDFMLPNFILHKLLFLCCKMRRPLIAWQSGFILQDAFVETLFHIVERASGSSLNFCVHMVQKEILGTKKDHVVNEMLWNTAEQYKIILDYVLSSAAVPHTYNLVSGKVLPPGEAAGLISCHQWKLPSEEEDPANARLTCGHCGTNSATTHIPWTLFCQNNHSFLNPEFIKQRDADVKQQGNILTFVNKGKCYLLAPIEAAEQNCFKVTFIDGPVESAKVSLGFVLNEKSMKSAAAATEDQAEKSAFLLEIQLDLGDGAVLYKRNETVNKMGQIPEASLPRLGDSLRVELTEVPTDGKVCRLIFYRNEEVIGQFQQPRLRYIVSLESKRGLSVMIHPLMQDSLTKGTKLNVGMRLEALDRKNPHLICVATITDIADSGQVKIHFDGWNSGSYDYYTDFSSPDLHPVGWMSKNKKNFSKLRQELQPPKGMGEGRFSWPKYCVDEESFPVPLHLFSTEQIGTPSEVEEECLMALEQAGFDVPTSSTKHIKCRMAKHRPKVFENITLNKCAMDPALFDFFSNQSKFLCLLPCKFDLNMLKYPSVKALMDSGEQNVHILCPGLKMELLHFVDYQGTKLSRTNVSDFAAYLQNCYFGLIIQQGRILPQGCSQLCPGITSFQDKGQFDIWMKRLCFLNACYMELLQYITMSQGMSVRDIMDIFSDCMKDSKPRLIFQQTETYVRCTGHVLASMAGNEINAVPMEKYSQFYPFIQKLDFQNNFLECLPANFFQCFINLEYLSVANNQLTALPDGLENVKNLCHLDISMNNILDLPKNFDVLADSLVYLNVSDNPLSALPQVFFKLTKLEELHADNIGVVENFTGIKNLTELNTLSLARNVIKDVPAELADLPLVSLDLSGVPWFEQLTTTKTFLSYRAFNQTLNMNVMTKRINEKERQEMFKKVDADESSTLTADEVLALNDVLCKKYERFGSTSMEYKETGGVPPPILKLKKLKTLVLKYHLLKYIPDEIKELISLKEFDVSYNPQLTSLTAELSGLPLKMIHLQECSLLKTPPKEIVARGFVAVIGYLKRLRLGASPCKRTKLMLVGLGGAGKTSLVAALMNSRFRANLDFDEAITDGIDISKWEVPVKGEKDPLTFSVWDFAGQTVYYNTHQFFLSNRAVYLLLWNVRQGYEHAGLDFWLSSIACHAPKAPILIVGTHSDKVEKCKLPEASIQSRFPQICGFYYVSSYTGSGVPQLKQSIMEVALQQKYMGEKIPEAWLTLEKKLIVLREEQKKDFLMLKQLEAVAASAGIFEKNELIQAVQFLHDLGAAQFFDTDFLRSIVVIYPQWIVDVMACLVTVHEGVVKDGRLNLKDISGVWSNYPKELHPWLLRLTEEFDLTCPLPDKDITIVPCLLPDTEPKYEWSHADPEKNIRESLTVYKFQYLPAGLFNRAQARLHQYSEGTLLWKKGSFLKKNDHKAVLLQTETSEVIVRAQGFRPENFLFLVHEIIETLIAESYSGVRYDFLVPCLECLNMNVKDPSMISYMKVQRALELNAPFLQCDKFFHILSIQELRDTMPSDKMSEIDSHLRNSVRELIDLELETTINVFFMYSTKNVPSLENDGKEVHPGTVIEDLRKHSNLRITFSDKPESSDMEAITLSVKASNVVMVGMSDEFCDDSECRKLLLYIKDVLRKPVLLLLLGKTKNWQKGDLNLVFGSEVYVDMQKIERYPHKIQELYEVIKKKAAVEAKTKDADSPDCFISYCWANSHDAISKGSRSVEGALGWEGGDPRGVKTFLEEKGVRCWLDVEKIGGTGLFHSIADGLREAKIMVAFVSDQYVKSKNCIMEFRYALTTLRIPVIVVVVGTGYAWERSEVGLLVVGHACPKLNFQFPNEAGNLELLKLVQEKLPEMGNNQLNKANQENQRNIAFQEVFELTQRKFLRHMMKSVSSQEAEPYPRLIVIDFITDKERQQEIQRQSSKKPTQGEKSKEKGDDSEVCEIEGEMKADGAEEETNVKPIWISSKYCFRLLCEFDEGWHETSVPIFFPKMEAADQQQIVDSWAPYLGRVYAILKHGKSQMECLNTPEGEKFQQKIEEICMKSGSDFYEEYLELRTLVMQQDKAMVKGKLQRCQVNGKMVWLCEEHKNVNRSQIEQKYQTQFEENSSNIPIPVGELPENYVAPEPREIEEEEQEAPKQVHRKIFKRSSESATKLQRQTSQMCSIS